MSTPLCFFCGYPLDIGKHAQIAPTEDGVVPVICDVPMRILQPQYSGRIEG